VLDSLCHKLARPARVTRCLHLVDDWYLPWFNFLLHEVNAHQICQMAGLCGAGGFMKVRKKVFDDLCRLSLHVNGMSKLAVRSDWVDGLIRFFTGCIFILLIISPHSKLSLLSFTKCEVLFLE
jgi:hypothetical protein